MMSEEEYKEYEAAKQREYAEYERREQTRTDDENIILAAKESDSPIAAQREVMAPGEATRGPPGGVVKTETQNIKTVHTVSGRKRWKVTTARGRQNTAPLLKTLKWN